MYPLTAQYFDAKTKTLHRKLRDFIEDHEEDAESIANNIKSVLERNGLNVKDITSYCADNAPVNFGRHNSVFTKLHAHNQNIARSRCYAHIIHNTAKKFCDVPPIDVENIVTKVYGRFSISGLRRNALMEFVEFVNEDYTELLHHVPTRWSSFAPAIKRLLDNWPALISYFCSIDDCPARIQTILRLKRDGTEEDKVEEVEIWLRFILSSMNVFERSVRVIEGEYVSATEVYDIMYALQNNICTRIEDKYYGIEHTAAMAPLMKQSPQKSVDYLQKWFDFSSDNYVAKLRPLSLSPDFPTFEQLKAAADCLSLSDNDDRLFNDYCAIKQTFEMPDTENVFEKWGQVLRKCSSETLVLSHLMSVILSIPASNASCEGVFSLMAGKWTNVRSRVELELIRAELIVNVNYTSSCLEF